MAFENKLTKKNLVLPFIGDKHYVLLTFHGEKNSSVNNESEAVLNSQDYGAFHLDPMQGRTAHTPVRSNTTAKATVSEPSTGRSLPPAWRRDVVRALPADHLRVGMYHTETTARSVGTTCPQESYV